MDLGHGLRGIGRVLPHTAAKRLFRRLVEVRPQVVHADRAREVGLVATREELSHVAEVARRLLIGVAVSRTRSWGDDVLSSTRTGVFGRRSGRPSSSGARETTDSTGGRRAHRLRPSAILKLAGALQRDADPEAVTRTAPRLHQADRDDPGPDGQAEGCTHGLADEWSATFDLAAGRAGICYFWVFR